MSPVKLDWPHCRNARDLGGLPTVQGARVRDGALIRSDHHARLTPAAVAGIRASGVRRIIDLRWVGAHLGDAATYLLDAGVSAAQLEAVRTRLVSS